MASDGTPTLGEYLAALRRRRLLIIIVALPIMLIALILAIALSDVYRSSATFRLVTNQIGESAETSGEYADEYILSLADRVLRSDNLAGVLRESDPYPELGDDEATALAELRDNVTVEMTIQSILDPGGGQQRNVQTGFVVSYDHGSAATAQHVASGLAQIFVELSRTERLAAASNQVKFYAGEADRTSREIAEFERQLAEFKERNFELLPETTQTNLTLRGRLEQELDGVVREIGGLQQNRVFVAQQLRQAQAGPGVDNLRQLEDEYARKAAIYSENHPDVVTLRRQIESLRAAGPSTGGNTLQGQLARERAVLAEARQRYGEDHPDIRRIQRIIEMLEARIAAGESPTDTFASESLLAVQLQTQLNALDTQLAGLRARERELRLRLVQFESRLGSTPEVEREYQSVTRGVDTARQQYDQMVARRMDAEMEVAAIAGGAADRFELTSAPTVPWEPAQPKRIAIVVIGLILAAIVALSAAVVAEALDSRVRGAADVCRELGRSPLALVPEIHNSVYWRGRKRRVAMLGGTALIMTPVVYLLVHLLFN